MKMSGDFILGVIILCVLLFFIFWMVEIQTKKEKEDITDKVISEKVLKRSISRGRTLFIQEDCYSCHKPDKKDGFFRVVIDRVSKEWLYKFIRDEKSLIEDKDSVVLYLRQRFNQSNGKHDKKHLTNDQLNDILNYLNSFKVN